jgi:hypothetical protein
MQDMNELTAVVQDLIDILQFQAKELEKLITHVAQVTTRLPEANEIAVVRSELSALQVRVRKLRGLEPPG